MALYRYKIIDDKGMESQGTLRASSEQRARKRLHASALAILTVDKVQRSPLFSRRVPLQKTVEGIKQLACLLRAHVPLHDSLLMLLEQTRDPSLQQLFQSLARHVHAGSSLSQAMASLTPPFSDLHRALVQSGECIGDLPEALTSLAALLHAHLHVQQKVMHALLYPAILALFCCGNFVAILLWTVPAVEELLALRPLGGASQLLIATSQGLRAHPWLVVALATALALTAYGAATSRLGSFIKGSWLLSCPLLGTLIIQKAVTQWAQTLATLLHGGLPLTSALPIACQTLPSFLWRRDISRALEQMAAGGALSSEMRVWPHMPPLVVEMLATGEKSGNIKEMLQGIAQLHQEQLERNLQRLHLLLPSSLLIAMGACIGVLMWSLLQPLTHFTLMR